MDILGLLDAKGISYLHKGGDEYGIVCPRQTLHAGGKDSRPSFDINILKEVGNCPACGFKIGVAGLRRWLMGDDLDDIGLLGLEISGILKRIAEAPTTVPQPETDFFFPSGSPWDEDGYRGISLATYRELGATRVSRGRYQNRICLPVWVSGKLVGVDARALGDEQPKYIRNKNSSCKHNWLFPYDRVKNMKPSMVLLGEGLFHAINGYDKGFPTLCFFGANNWSHNKVMLLLDTGATEVCYFPDPDKAGFQAAQRVCASLLPWFKVSVANVAACYGSGKDLGDLSQEEIAAAVQHRGEVPIPECLRLDWEHKLLYGAECRRWKCFFNKKSTCCNEFYKVEVKESSDA